MKRVTIAVPIAFLLLSASALAEQEGLALASEETFSITVYASSPAIPEEPPGPRFSLAVEPLGAFTGGQFGARAGVRVGERLGIELAVGTGPKGTSGDASGPIVTLGGGYYFNPAVVVRLSGRMEESGWYVRTGPVFAVLHATEAGVGSATGKAFGWMVTSGYQLVLGSGLYTGLGLGLLTPIRDAQFTFSNGDRAGASLGPFEGEIALGLSF